MTLATNLTLLRIGLIPIFVLFFYLPLKWSHAITAMIFALASFTDWLDGFLARKMNQTSAFGAFLDPVADKLIVAIALILLVQSIPSPWLAIPAAVIIGREIAVSALREWMAEIGKRTHVAVNIMGKVKTISQMLAILLLLYQKPVGDFPTQSAGYLLLYLAAGMTLWSMMVYLYNAWPSLISPRDG